MKTLHLLILACLLGFSVKANDAAILTPTSTIPLPGVKGRIDHFTLDPKVRQMALAALGNNTVEILDLKAGQPLRTITGCRTPQGVLFVRDSRRICVANGGDGSVRFYDRDSGALVKRLDKMDDADNVRVDLIAGELYVGYGAGALAVISTESMEKTGDIKLAGHPESFQLEQNGPRVFVNVPDAGHVAVVDRAKKAVIATWPLPEFKANFPMALDEKHQRLFIGCRRPARLVVLDTSNGHIVTNVAIAGDTDDLFYDAARRRIYVSCGEGFLDVIEQSTADAYAARSRIATASGARTSFFDATTSDLFLAVPARGTRDAEVRVYHAQP